MQRLRLYHHSPHPTISGWYPFSRNNGWPLGSVLNTFKSIEAESRDDNAPGTAAYAHQQWLEMIRYDPRTYNILEMPEGLAAATALARRQFEAEAAKEDGREPYTRRPEDEPPEVADLDLKNVSAETLRLLDILMGREPSVDAGQQPAGEESEPADGRDDSSRDVLRFRTRSETPEDQEE